MTEYLTVSREQLRTELAVDLARGGYVYFDGDDGALTRYFNKYLVLAKPGLVARAAQLLGNLLTEECERIVVTSIASAVLGAAVAQLTGIPMLLATDQKGVVRFGGETFPRVQAILVEDVVHTGGRALMGVQGLATAGATATTVICLLDRQAGATGLLADAGFTLRALFTEQQLISSIEHGSPSHQ